MKNDLLPQELINAIVKREIVLFLGNDIFEGSSNANGLSSSRNLAKQLAEKMGGCEQCEWFSSEQDVCLNAKGCVVPFSRVAQHFQALKGRHALNTFIRETTQRRNTSPPIYQWIIKLPLRIIVTTNYDELLERSLYNASIQYNRITKDFGLAYEESDVLQIIKMHGSIDDLETLVLTDDDQLNFFDKLPLISDVLKYYFVTKTLLFIGFDLDDNTFKRLYHEVTRYADRHKRRAYAIQLQASQAIKEYWKNQKNLEIIDIDPTEFLKTLVNEAQSAINQTSPIERKTRASREVVIRKSPYKFLDYFGWEDADAFFGRDNDVARVIEKILSHGILILFADSGVGKTSLINAGIIPKLSETDYIPIYVRCTENVIEAINAAVRGTFLGEIESQERSNSYEFSNDLVGLLAFVETVSSKTIVIFLDQFEEIFIRVGEQERLRLAEAIGRRVQKRSPGIRFVVSIRKDFFVHLNEFSSYIPEIFNNRYLLENLSRTQASQAIVEPAKRVGVTFEDKLVEKILDDLLDQSGITPSHLQIICDRLYGSSNEKIITLEFYDKIGGAQLILGDYLNYALERYPEPRKSLAKSILKQMTTSLGTKALLRQSEIYQAFDSSLSRGLADSIIDDLISARLIRRITLDDEEYRYELSHEIMTDKIKTWISREENEIKAAQELLSRELTNWKSGFLLDSDKLEVINRNKDKLKLGVEERELLLRASLQYGLEVEYWLTEISDLEKRNRLLMEGLDNENVVIQKRAITFIGKANITEAIPKLISFLSHEDSDIRARSVSALGDMNAGESIPRLIPLLRDEASDVRKWAAEALGKMNVSESIPELIALLQDDDSFVSGWAAEALGRMKAVSAVPILVNMLDDESQYVRKRVVLALEEISTRETIPHLLRCLGDRDEEIRERAANALGKLQVTEAIPALVPLLWDESDQVRKTASTALSKMDPKASVPQWISLLTSQDSYVRGWAVSALGESKDPSAISHLVGLLEDESRYVRERVVIALINMNPLLVVPRLRPMLETQNAEIKRDVVIILGRFQVNDAVPHLIKFLEDDNPAMRVQAANLLGNMKAGTAIQALISVLWDEIEEVRKSASEALNKMNPSDAIPIWVKLLEDEQGYLRGWAATFLGNMNAVDAIPNLISLLKDKDSFARRRAAEALVRMPPQGSVHQLYPLLKSENSYTRKNAAIILGNMGETGVTSELILLLGDEDIFIRIRAADALGTLQATEAIPALVPLLWDESDQVRKTASTALSKMDPKASVPQWISLLTSQDSYVRGWAVSALGESKDPSAISHLVGLLEDESRYVRERVVIALINMNPLLVVPHLRPMLESQNADLKRDLAIILGRFQVNDAVPHLINLLEDDNPAMRVQAANLLGNMKAGTAIQALISVLWDEIEEVQKSASESLNKMEPSDAVAIYKDLLRHEEGYLRGWAATFLGNMNAVDAIPNLISLLKDKDSFARRRAVEALGKMESVRVIHYLKDLSDDKDSQIREGIALAVGYTQSQDAIPLLISLLKDEDIVVRRSAAEALAGLHNVAETISQLVVFLAREYPEAVSKVSLVFEKMTAGMVISHLQTLLTSNNSELREGAIRALGILGDTDIISILETYTFDPKVDKVILDSIEQIKDRFGQSERK